MQLHHWVYMIGAVIVHVFEQTRKCEERTCRTFDSKVFVDCYTLYQSIKTFWSECPALQFFTVE